MAIVAIVVAYCVFLVLVLGTGGWILSRLQRRRRMRRAQQAAVARDRQKAQLELEWLRSQPALAPHVVYPDETEYDADLERMTLMGYVPIEVYRTDNTDGSLSYDVRYQLQDQEQFKRAARELAERDRLVG